MAPNFKVAAPLFVTVTKEVIKLIEEDSIPKSAKYCTKFGVTLKRKI